MARRVLDLRLDGEHLNLRDAIAAATATGPADAISVTLDPQAMARVAASRRQVEAWLVTGAPPIYGFNTGLGPLKNQVVPLDQQEEFQRRILLSHATATGSPLPEEVVRLAMLLRANVLARGHSGVRPALIQRLLDLVAAGVTPVVGSEGSLGLGDLPQMAQIGLVVAGMPQGRARWRDREGPAPQILARAGLPAAFPLGAREALALVSGSTLTLAIAAVAAVQAEGLLAAADLAAALTLEALRGEPGALDTRVHAARPHPGQMASAARIRRLLAGSRWLTPEARSRLGETLPRVQDAISLRCTPQVHGAVLDTLAFALTVLQREVNASTDNPLLFPREDGGYEAVSGGNSHGAPIGYVADFLAIALADLAVLSERRSFRLLDPSLSFGLPPNLVAEEPGLNSGLAVAQASATAMIAELRCLASPASCGSLPTKGNQEDHVSMGTWSARKLLRIVELAQWVVAMEILCACRAIELLWPHLGDLPLGEGTGAAFRLVRDQLPGEPKDGWVLEQWRSVHRLIATGALTQALSRIEEPGAVTHDAADNTAHDAAAGCHARP